MAKNIETDNSIEKVESALTKAEQFIEDNQKVLTIVVVTILVVVGLFFGLKKYYLVPREKEAQSQMFVAEQYFEKDSFKLALNGDGNYLGFNQIIDDYGFTNSANLAHYYAGISYLHLGEFQNAIDQLNEFDSNDQLVAPIAKGAIGDAYIELGNKEKALESYLDAANLNKNQFTSPIYIMKAGMLYEQKGAFIEALELYEELQSKYPTSNEGRSIEKYITRAKLSIQ